MPIIQRIFWSLAALGGLYGVFLGILISPSAQRFALYANKIDTSWIGWNVRDPESFGFAKGQITPFNISTPDGEQLYAWHVMPLGLYAKHEEELLQQPEGPVDDFRNSFAANLLKDPEARIVINCRHNKLHTHRHILN